MISNEQICMLYIYNNILTRSICHEPITIAMRIMPAAIGTDFTNEAFRQPRIRTVSGQTTITFHNILYEVEVKKNDIPLCGGKESKTILKGVR